MLFARYTKPSISLSICSIFGHMIHQIILEYYIHAMLYNIIISHENYRTLLNMDQSLPHACLPDILEDIAKGSVSQFIKM